MKLIRLAADNFMRLSAVEITPDGRHVVQITGANGAGKSSVLRALECALGGKDKLPAEPVRHGADFAEIRVDLGRYVITRKIHPDGKGPLVVASPEGARFQSPQKLLDDLLGALSFDPLAFSRMKPADRRDQLARIVGLSDMLAELAVADRVDRENRQNVNRDLSKARAQLEALPVVEPCAPVDVSATLAELRAAQTHNGKASAQARQIADNQANAQRLRERAATKRDQAKALLDEADAIDAEADALETLVTSRVGILDLIDTAALEQALENAEATNAQVRAYESRAAVAATVAELANASKAYDDAIETREAERRAVIEAATFPIAELGLTEDGVTYKGVPLEQASSAEQLRVSAAIGMALNPELRVMLIRDGSLLDEQSLAMLASAAEAEDFLLLIESVDTSGTVGFYIEDGSVRAVDGQPIAQAAA